MATNIKVKELLKNYPRQNFGKSEVRQRNIDIFMSEHPELFQWFFNEPGGNHSKNLLESDLETISTTILRFTDLIPGTKIRLVFSATGEFYQEGYVLHRDYEDIVIGATGNYYADDINPVYGIYFIKSATNTSEYPSSPDGTVAYQYQVPIRNSFDSIKSIETDIGSYAQLVGNIPNLVEHLDCTKEQVTKIAISRYFKRPVGYLFYKGKDLAGFVEDIYEPEYTNNYHDLVPVYKNNLYWDTNYEGTFDEKENMEHSPFAIYVLRNSYVTADGVSQDILRHIKRFLAETGETHTHNAEHMFEKYYIDRYMYAQTAEDMLTERMSLAARIAAAKDDVEKAALTEALQANPLYVLDPVVGKVYKAGENYTYDPAIYYNNEQIDLREIQRYDLNSLEPTETTITVGNGVYCDVFYQKVVMNYNFEDSEDNLSTIKNKYESTLAALKVKRAKGLDPLRSELDELDQYYSQYNEVLSATIKSWVTRETDLEK